jgi:[ribosomal protein S5]-alanine N-acetyltransferase
MITKIFSITFASCFFFSIFASQPPLITYDIATDMRLKPYEHFIAGDTFFLRPLFPQDHVALRPIFTDQKVMQYFGTGKAFHKKELKIHIKNAAHLNSQKFLYWIIINSVNICGFAGIYYPSKEHPETEIGYAINPQFSGNGLATRAAAAIMKYIKGPFIANVYPKNIASQRVLTKLGFLPDLIQKNILKGNFIRDYWYLKRINL